MYSRRRNVVDCALLDACVCGCLLRCFSADCDARPARRFLQLSYDERVALARAVGTTADQVVSNLLELDLSLSGF